MAQSVAKNNIDSKKLIKIEDALVSILEAIKSMPLEEIVLTEALGRVLAEDIYSDINIPQLDNSAMDGYALRAEDTSGASQGEPKILDVVDDLRAGYVTKHAVKKNQAVRIMTGAPVPSGADSVLMVEYTEREGENKVKIFKGIEKDENIRKAGEDIKKDELVISKGTLLNSGHVGILASLGRSIVKVAKKPKVGILATGDEVIDVNEKLEPGKLRSSNTYTLYSQVIKHGGIVKNLGIAKDAPLEVEKKIKKGLDCDLILTSGGVSVGDYDFVKDVLAKLGADIKFWKVAMKPGKPLVFGTINGIPVFGLPGNPVSSMVSFEVFVMPSIFKMLGQSLKDTRRIVDAVLEEDVKKKKGLKYFLRANTRYEDGVFRTRTTGPQGSGILKSIACADSLIILPYEKESLGKGTKVQVVLL